MVYEDFGKKLKKVKARSKITPSSRLRVITIIVGIISIVITSFIVYNLYHMEMEKRAEELNKAKAAAIESIKKMFLPYPDDPHFNMYIVKIESSTSIEEINKVIEEATRYIELRKYKDNAINTVKKIYGKYYDESPYAQSIVYKIQRAVSKQEIERILRMSNIEEDAKRYYIEEVRNKVEPDKYYAIPVFKKKKLMKGVEVINYIERLSLTEIKNITKEIEPVSFNKVAIVVPAVQCGKVPFEGSKVEIYDRSNTSKKPIPGIVDSSHILIRNINYTETKHIFNTLTEDKYTSELSSTSGIKYFLTNVPGILYATAAEKLDYYKIINKFGKYGDKFNKITSDTQLFDEKAKYLLIVSVPSTDIPRLLSIEPYHLYITVTE